MTDEIDTSNDHMVTRRGGRVLIGAPPSGAISKTEALRLAAWLVVMADDSDHHTEFMEVLTAIEST
jgi:hypothetical protein